MKMEENPALRNPQLTLLSSQSPDESCGSGDARRVRDVQRNGAQPVGGTLLQLVLALLGVAARDHPVAHLVQVPRQQVAESGVAPGDVDVLLIFVGDPFALLVPAMDKPENHQPQDIQPHVVCKTEGKPVPQSD